MLSMEDGLAHLGHRLHLQAIISLGNQAKTNTVKLQVHDDIYITVI